MKQLGFCSGPYFTLSHCPPASIPQVEHSGFVDRPMTMAAGGGSEEEDDALEDPVSACTQPVDLDPDLDPWT